MPYQQEVRVISCSPLTSDTFNNTIQWVFLERHDVYARWVQRCLGRLRYVLRVKGSCEQCSFQSLFEDGQAVTLANIMLLYSTYSPCFSQKKLYLIKLPNRLTSRLVFSDWLQEVMRCHVHVAVVLNRSKSEKCHLTEMWAGGPARLRTRATARLMLLHTDSIDNSVSY